MFLSGQSVSKPIVRLQKTYIYKQKADEKSTNESRDVFPLIKYKASHLAPKMEFVRTA